MKDLLPDIPYLYCLILVAFVALPAVCYQFGERTMFKWVLIVAPFFLVHNICYYIGFSFRGDYIDYHIFSLEYCWFTLAVFSSTISNALWVKILRVMGWVIIILGYVAQLLLYFLFIILAMDAEDKKKYYFSRNGENFEVRASASGFATSSFEGHYFATYRLFKSIPLEQKVDETDFLVNIYAPVDSPDSLFVADLPSYERMKYAIIDSANKKYLVFTSVNGYRFVKRIDH